MANSGEKPFEFRVPATIHVGVGSHERVVAEAARVGAGNVLVVTDANVRATPTAGQVIERLSEAGLLRGVFSDIPGEPTTTEVEQGLIILRKARADTVVAVGGFNSASLLYASVVAAVFLAVGNVVYNKWGV